MPCQTVSACQFAGTTNIPYSFDVGIISVLMWQPNMSVVANQFVRPSNGNETGYIYQNGATPGQTAPFEPAWPTPATAIVADAALNWTAVAPPAVGQDAIQSVTWAQLSPPDGTLSITGITHTPLTTSAFVSGGTKGSVYTILIESTMTSGAIYPIQLVVTID